jgi:hypothetical protein
MPEQLEIKTFICMLSNLGLSWCAAKVAESAMNVKLMAAMKELVVSNGIKVLLAFYRFVVAAAV